MRKFIDILNETTQPLEEAPISDITSYGNWDKNAGYVEQDRKLLSNPKAVAKMKGMWKHPDEVDYNILLVNNPEANRIREVGVIGPVGGKAEEWLRRYMPKTAEELISNLKEGEVNIIFTNNKGSARVPMTGWVMAHRFGHALNRGPSGNEHSYYFNEAANTFSRYLANLAELYGAPLNGIGYGKRDQNALLSSNIRGLVAAICTFKSARENNLRTTYEALYELFAQYILTGSTKFNPVPDAVKVGRTTYRIPEEDKDHANGMIGSDLSHEIDSMFSAAIFEVVGKVLVM